MAVVETQNTRLYWATSTAASTAASNLVGNIVSIGGGLGAESPEIDITTFDSTAREYILGLRDFGDMTLELVWNNTNVAQAALEADQASKVRRRASILFSTISITASSTNARKNFDAFCKSFTYNLEADNVVRCQAVLRITGAVESTKQTT